MGQDEHSLFRNRALARTPQIIFLLLFIFLPLAAQKRNFGRAGGEFQRPTKRVSQRSFCAKAAL